MEFGKLENISTVKWPLPPDDPSNSISGEFQQLYFGAPAWGSRHWVEKIYPKGTPTDKFLSFYSRNFNCIELNTSHYRIPTEETVASWLSEVPPSFRFCPKLHKDISHNRLGLFDKTILAHWYSFLESLHSNLGPCFIQFHEKFSYHDKAHLFRFIENWPRHFKLSIELRHPSWFEDQKILPALGEYLRKKGVGLVITDVAGRRDVLHSTVTSDFTFIRLIGNDLHSSDESRLHEWSLRLCDWKKKGLKNIYLMLHQPDDILTIEFAQLAEKVLSTNGFDDVPHFTKTETLDLFSTSFSGE